MNTEVKSMQKINEERILKNWQNAKDEIFGLYQPFYIDFFEYDHQCGYQYSHQNTLALIKSITDECDQDNEAYASVLPKFLETCLMFLYAACNMDDWVYASLIKISKTVIGHTPEVSSVFDFMIEDSNDDLNEALGAVFFKIYNEFLESTKDMDLTDFPDYLKSTIEKHIDKNHLNCLHDDFLTEKILSLIDNFSRQVALQYQRR